MNSITSWRHLFSAVLRLGAAEGTVDQRLREAYYAGLARIPEGTGLPENLQKEYVNLMDELNALFGGADTIDMKQASRLAKRIVALYDRVSREL